VGVDKRGPTQVEQIENFWPNCFFTWEGERGGLEFPLYQFFGMVRVKVACKDVEKIPQKRLFEMERRLYLIHFKVER
jgi:hypothetical protein